MPTVQLPIAESIIKAVDEVGLVTHGAELDDGYVDELGNINRRPGLVEFIDTGENSPIDGLFWWEAQDLVLVVCNGKTFKITANDGTFSEITNDTFEIGTRVTFADFGTAVYAANGAKMMKIITTSVDEMADADAPTTVTHVAFLDRYLLGNQTGTRYYHFSNVGDPDTWDAEYCDVEGKLDNLVAVGVADLAIAALGEKTMEIWRDDGSTPFVREDQGFVETGTIAPYSFTWCAGAWYWLDQDRRVVRLEGITPVNLSVTMTKYIQDFSTVNDAMGDFMVIDGRPWYVLHFPTEEKTLAYDISMDRWYLWNYWDASGAQYLRWRGNCYCLAPGWNFALVGDRANGKVYKLDNTNYDDDGDILRTMIRTAHYNHGTELRMKQSHSLTFRLKRTNVVSEAAASTLLVKWRDDGKTTWNTERTVSLGQVGETAFRGQIRRLGKYYDRQYQITLTDSSPLVLVSVEENFDYL